MYGVYHFFLLPYSSFQVILAVFALYAVFVAKILYKT